MLHKTHGFAGDPIIFSKKHKDVPIGVAFGDRFWSSLPPVNQTPSLTLGHLIYWG